MHSNHYMFLPCSLNNNWETYAVKTICLPTKILPGHVAMIASESQKTHA